MAFGGFIQTAKGRNMLTRAENGVEMTITHIAVGEGFFTSSYNDIERLVQPKFTLPCTVNVIDAGLLVEADLTNAELAESYYLRELGVYATDGKTSVLYVYDNAGTDAQLIQSSTSAVGVAKRLRFILTKSADAKVTVSGVGILYVTPDELEQRLEGYAPTGSLTALEAALAQHGTNLAALTTVVTAQGVADAQHIADEVKHITAADRAVIAAKANAANAALTGITTMETAKLTGNLTLKGATNFATRLISVTASMFLFRKIPTIR